LRAIYAALVHNLKFPFAGASVVTTKKPAQGALGGIKFVIYARVPS
jgi:hypothetical protein